jgi:hypothetical protein
MKAVAAIFPGSLNSWWDAWFAVNTTKHWKQRYSGRCRRESLRIKRRDISHQLPQGE